MQHKTFGNGSGKGVIHRTPLGPGWVVYHAGSPPPEPEDLPLALDDHPRRDLQAHSAVRVRAALPIIREGNIIAIHLWYDTEQA